MAIVWIAIAVVLVAVELHHFAFFAIFGAAGGPLNGLFLNHFGSCNIFQPLSTVNTLLPIFSSN